jgi:hypothetical protein
MTLPPKPYQLEGSLLWRVWCVGCHEPMRVNGCDREKPHWCEECSPGKPPGYMVGLTPRQKAKLNKTSG